GEVGLHDAQAGIGKLDGFDVCVANAGKLVGKKVKVRVERVLDGTAYATLADAQRDEDEPITAEREAEKPTRAPTKKAPATDEEAVEGQPTPRKRTRRGSRGGKGRKKKTTTTAAAAGNGAGEAKQVAKIHVPDPTLGEEPEAEEPTETPETVTSEDGAAGPKPRKKTRRGTRGGRGRRKKTTAAAGATDNEDPTPEPAEEVPDWGYVPMSEWADDVLSDK